jgi:hypothetical protein
MGLLAKSAAVPTAIQAAAEQEQETGRHKPGQLHFQTDSIDQSDLEKGDLEKGGVRVPRKRDHILLQKKPLHMFVAAAAAGAMALVAGHKAAEPESIPAVAAALKDTVAGRNLQVRDDPSQDSEHTVAQDDTAVLVKPLPLDPFQVMRGHSCMAPETQLEAYPSQEMLGMMVVRLEQGQELVIQMDRMDCHLQAGADMPPVWAWPRTGFQDPPWLLYYEYAVHRPKSSCVDR